MILNSNIGDNLILKYKTMKRNIILQPVAIIKQMRKQIVIQAFVAMLIFMGQGFFNESFAQKKKDKKVELTEFELTKRKDLFHTANKEKILGHTVEAETLFKAVLDLDPNHDPSMYELARIYSEQGRMEDAILLMDKAIRLNNLNVWYQLFLAELYKNTGNFSKVTEVFQNLVNTYPEKVDYQLNLALAYIIMGDFKEAIGVFNNIENYIGVTEEISLKKQTLYLNMNKPDKALQEIERLSEHYPQESRYLQILAESYLSMGQNEKALATYKKIATLDPENPYIHISLSDYYRKNNQEEKAFEELKLGFANPALDIDSKVQILLSYYTLDQFYVTKSHETTELTAILVETHPGNSKAMAIYADLLYRTDKSQEALNVLNTLLTTDSSSYSVWEQKLFIENELQLNENLIETSQKTIELFPMQPLPYLFNGFANYQKKNYETALRSLETGSKLVVENDLLLAQFFSTLGDVCNQLKDHKKSDDYYDKALKLKPDDAFVLNNYSYYLSLRKTNLDKAREMAKRANELQPDNASFQDTYGWVLYQVGEFAEAEIWIKKALDHPEKDSAVLLEHYGDVLYKLGRTDEAFDYWQKAKDSGDEGSEFLDKKISNKKMYE